MRNNMMSGTERQVRVTLCCMILSFRSVAGTYMYYGHGMPSHVFESGVEKQISDLFEFFIKEKQTVFYDVGMNSGFYTAKAAHLGAHVLSFEPQAKCVSLVRRMLREPANSFLSNKVVINNIAVGRFGSIAVPTTTCDGGFHANILEYVEPNGTNILVLPFSSFFPREFLQPFSKICIKIDTEGSEIPILLDILRLRRRLLFVSWTIIVKLIPNLWAQRGSSYDEGLETIRRMMLSFDTILLTDPTPFKFKATLAELPGQVAGLAFINFSPEDLIKDRMRANAGCNILFSSHRGKGGRS